MNDPKQARGIFIKRHLSTLPQRNVQGNFAFLLIKRIHSFAGGYPECAFPVFTGRFDIAAAQAERVIRVVLIVDALSGRRIESVEASTCGEPQLAGGILSDVRNGSCFACRIRSTDAVMRECLSNWIEFVQEFIASNPKRAETVFEQGVNVDSTQAIGNASHVLKNSKLVT